MCILVALLVSDSVGEDFKVNIVLASLSSVCLFAAVLICAFANFKKIAAWREAGETVRRWVELNLNEKYQNQYGIRWSISEETVIVGHGKKRGTIRYLHIVVQCIDTVGGGIVIQQPQEQVIQVYNPNADRTVLQSQPVVYVDQHGNPVNSQQIQVVKVHNQDGQLNTGGDQPPPAYQSAEASAPQPQGHTNY